MLKLKTLSLALCLSIFLVSVAFGNDIVIKLQKKYEDMQSLQAEFTQTLTHKESGSVDEKAGTLVFKKPLLVRWEVLPPKEELLLVTKDVIWNVFVDENVAYKYPLSLAQDNQSIVQVITGQAKLSRDFIVKNLGTDKDLVKLHLLPYEPVQSLVEAYLWINPKTYLIHQVQIFDFYGNTNEIIFKNHLVDAKIKESTFVFSLPSGMDLEDRINDSGAQILQ